MGIGKHTVELFGCLFIFVLFGILPAFAAECGTRPTENCTISSSITFEKDFYSLNYGFNIEAGDLVIDCNGATFNNTNPYRVGTLFDAENFTGEYWKNYTNITIQNCNIHNFEEGVWLIGDDFTFKNNNLVGEHMADDIAVKFYGGDYNIFNNTMKNMYFGFQLGFSSESNVYNNSFIDMDEEQYLTQYFFRFNPYNSNTSLAQINISHNYFDGQDSCDIIDSKIKDHEKDANLPEAVFTPMLDSPHDENPQVTDCKECIEPTGDSYTVTENTYICEGTYNLDDGFKIEADDVILDCFGSSFYADSSDLSRVGISSTKNQLSGITIKNCNFENYIHAIDFGNTNLISSELTNINIRDTFHEGIDLQNIIDAWIHDVQINFSALGSQWLGGLMIESADGSFIEDNDFISNGGYGLRILSSQDVIIDSNYFYNSTKGIYNQLNGDNVTVTGNEFYSRFSTGSHDEENALLLNVDNSLIKNNEFINGFPLAVDIEGNNNIFENNRFYVTDNIAGANDISLKLKGSENIIRNNQFEDASDTHIYLVSSDYSHITENTFKSNYYDSFYYQNHKNPVVIRTTTSYENIAANNTMNGSHDGHGTRPAIEYSYCPSSNCLDLENNNFFGYENYILLNNQTFSPKNISDNIRQNYWGPTYTEANLTCEYIDSKFYDDEETGNTSFAITLLHGILDVPHPEGNTVDCTYTCYGQDFNDPDVCSGNGACIAKDTCECNEDWSGSDCQDFSPEWNLTFDAGWNLVSLPMTSEIWNCSFVDTQMDYELIYQINPTTKKWDMCLSNNSKFSNLEFNTSRPFWIKVAEPLNEVQNYPINTHIEQKMNKGWNVIPYPWYKKENISVVFDDLDEITHIYEYNSSIWKLWIRDIPANPLTTMKPGKGYWAYSTDNFTLVMENGTASKRQ